MHDSDDWDLLIQEQADYEMLENTDDQKSYEKGSCGNCIMYALIAVACVIALGYLVSALD